VEDASGPVITNFRYVSPFARSDAAARPACLYGTTDNASLLTNAKVRLYNCDSAYDVFSIGVWSVTMVDAIGRSRDVVVNFDLGNGFRDLVPSNGGACGLAHGVWPCWGWVREGVAPSH